MQFAVPLLRLSRKKKKLQKRRRKKKKKKRKREEEEAPQPRCSLRTQGLPPEQFFLLADVVEDDKEEEEEEQQQQQEEEDEESPTKKSRVGKKSKLPDSILSSRGDKKKQFKYLCYQNRTRWVHNILIEILGDCVNKKGLENDGFDYLIGNQDVAKDALAFIEMLQLRLQFQIKVKLSDLDNTDSF